MAHVIGSTSEFRRELKVGDVFWYMTSRHRAPRDIQGPCTILGFSRDVRFGTFDVQYVRSRGDEEVIEDGSVCDLTNNWHGVFLNSADAYAYFEECSSL